ncbi:MAG: DMT family transporter [Alphaproteobacteria bacterium]
MTSASRKLRGWFYDQPYLLLTLTMSFWAGNIVLGRAVAGNVPPLALAYVRWGVGLAIILPFAWRHLRTDMAAIRRSLPILSLLGLTGITAYNSMAYIGLQYTQATNALVFQSSAPLLIALWSFILFRDRLSLSQIAGVTISLAGVLTIIGRGDWVALLDLSINRGDAWILAGLIAYAFYAACLRLKPQIHWLSFLAVTFFLGDLFLTPALLWEISTGYTLTLDLQTLLTLGYVCVFPSVLAYIFFNRGVEMVGANRAGPFFHLVPLIGAVLAIAFLGEAIEIFHVAGFAAVVAGIALTQAKRKKQNPPAKG